MLILLLPIGCCPDLVWTHMIVHSCRHTWKEDAFTFKCVAEDMRSYEESPLLNLNRYQRMLHRKGVTDAPDWSQTKIFPSFEDIFSSLRTPLSLPVLDLHYSSSISLTFFHPATRPSHFYCTTISLNHTLHCQIFMNLLLLVVVVKTGLCYYLH